MTEALIGLIGVVVGALFAGIVNSVNDRRKQVASGRVAARLIAEEIAQTRERMLSAERNWWEGDLPTTAWQAHIGELALGMDLTNAELKDLFTAYTLIDRWNVRSATEQFTDHIRAELDKAAEGLKPTETWLEGELIRPLLPRRQRLTAWIVATVLIVGFVGFEGLVPRPDLSSEGVASALQSELGPTVYVDCNPMGDEWSCTEHFLNPTVAPCGTVASPARTAGTGLVEGLVYTQDSQPCPKLIVAKDGDQLDATPASVETANLLGRLKKFDPKRRNFIERFVDAIVGRQP